MNIRLIAFDLDGTTLNSSNEISPGNRAALEKAYRMGKILVPCTGRALNHLSDALTRLLNELGFDAFPYIITANGAQAYYLPRRELIITHNIDEKTALELLAECRSCDGQVYASFGHEGCTDSKGLAWETGTMPRMVEEYSEKWYIPITDAEPLIKWKGGVLKLTVNFPSAEAAAKHHWDLSRWPAVSTVSGADGSLEFVKAGISKAHTLGFVAERAGVKMENIMAIGDHFNDLEMIEAVGFGVAMGNAIPQLKEKADWITLSNDEDGLAVAISKIIQ
ncbi:MAG: Cof-type HAD-IIB family hydrolase [Treponema sp.]|nr:Cof-type HAD-IIB family hydrolase [Treponema sp.]